MDEYKDERLAASGDPAKVRRAIQARKRQTKTGLTTYFIKGRVQTNTQYVVKKTGEKHPKIYKDKDSYPLGEAIQARTKEEA